MTQIASDRATGRGVQYVSDQGSVTAAATYTHSLDGPSGVVKVALSGVPMVIPDAARSEDVNQVLVTGSV